VTSIVLKYRVPSRAGQPRYQAALQDAQRAMSLVRSKAGELGIDPGRIGMLGFSAGGNLAAITSTGYDHRAYDAIDEADKISCRPDFAILIYPAWLSRETKDELVPEVVVTEKTPPMFLAHAGDDPIKVDASVVMYLALQRAKVPAELHVYAKGGHGFGMRASDDPCSHWPERCAEWMRSQKLLDRPAK
jgi:acetyl esterase/lipase